MNSYANDALVVRLSVRIYTLFLKIYPKSFRREYGPHMLQVFRDCSIRSFEREGSTGMLSLWALTLLDILRSSVEQYLEKETLMTKNTLIRLSGWAMILGGIATAIGFTLLLGMMEAFFVLHLRGTAEALYVIAFFWGPAAVGLGLLGLQARFGDDVGGLGKSALLLGGIAGTGLVVIGNIVQSLPNSLSDNGFWIYLIGTFLVFIALELYGILALVRKPQRRWNEAALVAGFPISLMALINAVFGPDRFDVLPLPVFVAFTVLFVGMAIGLGMLGYMVQADLSEELSMSPTGP